MVIKVKNDLISMQDLFYKKIFRIPDYQRGYSWGELQLKEFWSDLYNLREGMDHYTGMISLKELSSDNTKNWDKEKWLFNNAGYHAYHIVDGQQRLTTIVILINEIVKYYLNKYKDKKPEEIVVNSVSLSRIIEDYLYIVDPSSQNITKTYKFGYEVDNPSYEFFKHRILGEPNPGEIKETFYTLNLENAKDFFDKMVKDLVERCGIEELENLFRKLTQKLKFNLYYIDDDFNVFIAFETMNNRGKPLSYLELLKNRLIYLSTLFPDEETNKKIVRDEINETWKAIYGYLGRNKEKPLNDNDFLQNHWMIYFKYTRSNQITYNSFLLNDYFTQQNIFKENLINIKKVDDEEIVSDEDLIVIDDDYGIYTNKYDLTLGDINDYILSLKNLIVYWYQIHFPSEIVNEKIRMYLERLNILGFANFKPLATVLLSKQDISEDKKIEALKGMERFVFLHYRLNNYYGTYKNSFFYSMAHRLYFDEITIDDVINEVNKIEYLDSNNVIKTAGVLEKFEKYFNGNDNGFYSWATLRYVLYEYERFLAYGKGTSRPLSPNIFKADKKDSVSIEHIYPQTPTDEYWINNFEDYNDTQKYRLTGSLGNLLPLSKSINSSLQNDIFEDKKNGKNRNGEEVRRGYYNGSYNEIEVSQYQDWNADTILERGLKIVDFMQEEWNFKFQSRADKIRFLGLNFMCSDEDEYEDYYIIEEDQELMDNKSIIYYDLDEELHLSIGGIKYATGFYKDGGILVKAGSKLRTDVQAVRDSMQKKIDKFREDNNIQNGMYINDVFYETPSLAANVILGNHKNGWVCWKNNQDQTLDELVRKSDNYNKLTKNISNETMELFQELNKRVLNIEDVERVCTSQYFGYRVKENFLELHLNKNNLLCYTVNGDLYKTNKLLKHVPETYRWHVDTCFYITSTDDIDKYWDVIIDSYNNTKQ